MDKNHALPKEKLISLTERLRGPLQLSGMNSIATQSADNHSCVAIELALERLVHLVDYEGNTAF